MNIIFNQLATLSSIEAHFAHTSSILATYGKGAVLAYIDATQLDYQAHDEALANGNGSRPCKAQSDCEAMGII